MPQPKDHTVERNCLETMLRSVPGFKGYLEREYRRESDELLRNGLASRLQRSKRGLDDMARQLTDAAQLDALASIDRLRVRLDRVLGRIRGAMQGYSGFFDLVRIDERLLDRVYEHDMALNQQVDDLAKAVAQLHEKSDQAQTAIGEFLGQLNELERKWDEREDILKGLK